MKINNIGAGNKIELYKFNSSVNDRKNSAPKDKDVIEISDTGRYLSTFSENESIKKAGTKRVEEIKKEITEGNYKVDANSLAKKILDYIKGREV
ncbi:negative regulator of flagellin synthesis FlgM [Clostridium acetobutylicum]|uniref:Negative regulator of flagellin synthesis n=1 Tax=Clostridium acetobutylicum (strain ATCC 824 / DSM 792 / JCM 1419 / IAM 19013 / LMG 5710 / NBRC 13948 / NRRL B-527 / VKM B-1787 / 2291 / W) TaxID=272562 RepID=Q97H01_CLOAB|nr:MULTISPECIES: flagellar biosynthesis anti-sigma factor FlgM [Clostridium]AAK80171.1 Regulator of flagellin synthesis, FLGM [Clostridium acetobutylicum ATCC 824]ADZ21265.1 Regulator of flagellin synthesis, FLGM [Clostridium acetobutylicum EA 2018]AEI32235.1 regulator of flagellin synthesis, FLGM [Clostridium acetobutylicum DSM 1731]AWV79403.1 flagellar biosynthesis anti-sigma factor FlgM [Clostridium acetobutylicum]MBC2394625.1 flagellar biosynthesis anti-sigma factor FlgM [Clostridium aceto